MGHYTDVQMAGSQRSKADTGQESHIAKPAKSSYNAAYIILICFFLLLEGFVVRELQVA